jgi:hypothetical protein
MLIDSSRPPLIHVGWLSQQQTARAGPLTVQRLPIYRLRACLSVRLPPRFKDSRPANLPPKTQPLLARAFSARALAGT